MLLGNKIFGGIPHPPYFRGGSPGNPPDDYGNCSKNENPMLEIKPSLKPILEKDIKSKYHNLENLKNNYHEYNNDIKEDSNKDNNFGYISKDKILVLDKNFKKKLLKTQKICKKVLKNVKNLKNSYKHFMLKEIYEIPNSVLNTIKIYSKIKLS